MAVDVKEKVKEESAEEREARIEKEEMRELRRLELEGKRAEAEQRRRAEAAERERQEETDRLQEEALKEDEERTSYNKSWKGWALNKLGKGKYQKKDKEERQATGKGGSPISPTIVVDTEKDKNKEMASATVVVLVLVILIWILDQLPILGGTYVGYRFDIYGILRTNWLAVFSSAVILVGLLYNIVFGIIDKDMSFIVSFAFLMFVTQLLPILGEFPIAYGNLIALAIIIGLIFFLYKYQHELNLTDYASYLVMLVIFSFFYINWSWTRNIKSIIHVGYIIFFGFFYMAKIEKNPSAKYIMIPLLIVTDFYGFSIANYFLFKYIPLLTIFVSVYCWVRTSSKLAMFTFLGTIIFIIVITWGTSVFAEETPGLFERAGEAKRLDETLKDFASNLRTALSEIVVGSVDYATGGLYRPLVEKNQFEPLGVYFANVRAAQPRFYTDEPVTVWGAINSRTLTDPVVVEFNCYRYKESNRIPLDKKDDKIIPDKPFTVYTLEEKDVECTFKEGKLQAGTNRVTLSAIFNFETSGYHKAYFIDKERMRAMLKENLDPLKEFGIRDTSPSTVHTNGPIALSVTISTLNPVSEKPDVAPAFGIKISNRDKIKDGKGKVIGEWKGKIKKINELVVVLPNGIDLAKETCTPVGFEDYTIENCDNSCREVCKKGCEEFNSEPDKKSKCIDNCNDKNPLSTSSKKCNEECNALFKPDSGNINYKGYQLNLKELEKKYKDEFKDIDRYKEFVCRIIPKPEVLENVPITTKFVRVKARYDYLLENSFDIIVNQEPSTLPVAVVNTVRKFAYDAGIDPDLVSAIMLKESNGRHCCLEKGKNRAHDCKVSSDAKCGDNNIITSYDGSSIGIMQINVRDSPGSEWKTDASSICGAGKTVYDIDCNIQLGIEVLKGKYNELGKDGKERTYKCFNNVKTYSGWDAALRGYNGWGCPKETKTCNEACLRLGKECKDNQCIGVWNYVEIVKEAYDKIKTGQIRVESIPAAQTVGQILTITLKPQYDPSTKKITLRWVPSSNPLVTKYLVQKYIGEESSETFDNIKDTFFEDSNVEEGKMYTYTVIAIDDNYNIYGRSVEESITLQKSS